MARPVDPDLDRERADLPPGQRWREGMRRIEAVLFASATPVARDDLATVAGQEAAVDQLIGDLAINLGGRPHDLARVASGWMLRSRAACAPVIRATADVGGQALDLTGFDPAVLAAIAFHRPVGRDGLKEIFGKEISRDLIGRLADRDLIGTGPREPRRSAPCTFVTTDAFLAAFGLRSLRDLPDPGQMADAGLPGPA
jgi:chromosome segregation and condensation protein ScpB